MIKFPNSKSFHFFGVSGRFVIIVVAVVSSGMLLEFDQTRWANYYLSNSNWWMLTLKLHKKCRKKIPLNYELIYRKDFDELENCCQQDDYENPLQFGGVSLFLIFWPSNGMIIDNFTGYLLPRRKKKRWIFLLIQIGEWWDW